MEHLNLTVESDEYTQEDVWRILVIASAQAGTVEDTTRKLNDAPCANTVRHHLKEGLLTRIELLALEEEINSLASAYHNRHRIAIDLVFIPYHGKPAQSEGASAEQSQSRNNLLSLLRHRLCHQAEQTGHPRLHLCPGRRYTSWGLEASPGSSGGVRSRRALLVSGNFYAVEIVRFLKSQPFPSVIPAKVQGKRIKRLCRGRKSYRMSYTMASPQHGSEEVDLWIVCRYAKGKRGKHGVEHLPYVVIGDLSCPIPNVRKEHRGRLLRFARNDIFGVESSYRMMNQARARTTCRDPKYRLLLVGLALTLVNIWITLADVGSATTRGAVDQW